MSTPIVVAAALVLASCQSAGASREGERVNWSCDAGKEFSLRHVAGGVEVYAAGQTYRLDPSAEGQYSNGEAIYAEDGGRATLSGVYGGPYENCRRRAGDWWFRFW